MKNIRKLAALLLAVVLCASLAACAAPQTSVETLETSSTTEDGEPITTEKDPADFEMDVDGMCDYFEASGLVAGERVQMSYDVIGAVNGYKYTYQYNDSSVQLELYEFPTENIPEAAQTVIDSVRENGSFEILDNTVPAQLSESGRFMIIYTDAKAESGDEVSVAHRDHVMACFTAFAEAAGK